MLIAVIVLQVLILLALAYIILRMPESVEVQNVFTCGDVATAEQVAIAVRASERMSRQRCH